MSFKESDSDILTKISNRYIKTQAVFSSGGTPYSDATYTGRQFTSGGTLAVGTAGYFTALIIDAGGNGGTSNGTLAGKGGDGGTVKVITGYLNTGNYAITISTGLATATGFTPTSTLSTMTSGGGAGGNGYNRPRADGGNGPTITIAPFTTVLASGGGGGGGSTYGGAGAVGKTGGVGTTSGTVINSTTFGGGGGGGGNGASYRTGGTGGPGYFWIVSKNSSIDLSTTNDITNYTFKSSSNTNIFPLSDLLDNYLAVGYNPNVSMFPILAINNIFNYINYFKINGTAITTYYANLGYRTHPFTVDPSNPDTSFYCNYYNGIYTLIFTTTGTYAMTPSAMTPSANLTFEMIVVGNGGNGGMTSSSGKYASGGGSGGVIRATRSFTNGTPVYIRANVKQIFSGTEYDWSITAGSTGGNWLTANNGANGVSASLTPTVAGTNGATNRTGTYILATPNSTIGNYKISPTAADSNSYNDGIIGSTNYSGRVGDGNFIGGAGCGSILNPNLGGGGFFGAAGAATTSPYSTGYGAGGGVTTGTQRAGKPGIIIISFAYP